MLFRHSWEHFVPNLKHLTVPTFLNSELVGKSSILETCNIFSWWVDQTEMRAGLHLISDCKLPFNFFFFFFYIEWSWIMWMQMPFSRHSLEEFTAYGFDISLNFFSYFLLSKSTSWWALRFHVCLTIVQFPECRKCRNEKPTEMISNMFEKHF